MNKAFACTLLVLGLTISAFAQMPDVDDLEQKLNAAIPGFGNVNKTAVAENVQKAFKDKCEKNGGPDAFEAVNNGKDELQDCVDRKLNASNIMEELEEAKKTGSMDDVFGKYCNRNPDVMHCIKNFTSKLEKCLEPVERDNIKTILNITESLTNFLCYKDGDRMAMFIAEGGLECIQEKKDAIQECANSTFSKRIPKNPEEFSGEVLPMLLLESQDCTDFDEFHDCTVEKLEACKDNTPANIIDALFKFIRKSIPCKNAKKVVPGSPRSFQSGSGTFYGTPLSNNGLMVYAQTPANVTNQTESMVGIRDILVEKCRRHRSENPNALQEIEITGAQFSGCVRDNLRALMNGKTTCEKMKSDITNCGRNVLGKVHECLPPDEHYIKGFGIKSISDGLSYICEKNHFQTIFSVDGMQCLNSGETTVVDNCYKNTETAKLKLGNEIILTKDNLCNDLEKFSNCFKNYVNLQCPHIPDFSGNISRFLYHVRSPCRSHRVQNRHSSGQQVASLNSFMLLSSMAFSWILVNVLYKY